MNPNTRRTESKIHFGGIEYLTKSMTSMGFDGHPCVVISDSTVFELHGRKLAELLKDINCKPIIIRVNPGEQSKSRERYNELLDRLLGIPVDRSTPIIAFGGGVVGDLAGFVAATLFRGVPFFQVPTTLIAQVDSAIGGKTGINHITGKNLLGSFYPAESIIIDTSFLDTLNDREFRNGLAEVIKAGLIDDIELVRYLHENTVAIESRDLSTVQSLVEQAAKVKIDIVKKDEFESGVRAHLNFGHTFAHGIENTLGYGSIGHGEAVGVGMIAALLLSEKLDSSLNFREEIELIGSLVSPRPIDNLEWEQMEKAFLRDKKRTQGKSRFIVLSKLGTATIRSDIPSSLVKNAFLESLEFLN